MSRDEVCAGEYTAHFIFFCWLGSTMETLAMQQSVSLASVAIAFRWIFLLLFLLSKKWVRVKLEQWIWCLWLSFSWSQRVWVALLLFFAGWVGYQVKIFLGIMRVFLQFGWPDSLWYDGGATEVQCMQQRCSLHMVVYGSKVLLSISVMLVFYWSWGKLLCFGVINNQ